MIDYLLSSQAPFKGGAFPATDPPNFIANVILAAGVVIFKPTIERYFGLVDNRQSYKAIFDTGISPPLHGLSTLRPAVNPEKAIIATAVTTIQNIPTPVQVFQEQSIIGATLAVLACLILALIGVTLVFQHSRQGTLNVVSSSLAVSSGNGNGNGGSSSQLPSRGSTPPSDDSSDGPSGSGGRLPPLPIFDIFYDGPTLRADKSAQTNDKNVGDMDGAPPPPPPSFPTPVEDGDASNGKLSIIRWWFLSLVISIIIKRFFSRFVKGHGKTQMKVSTPTASERITVNEISVNVLTPIPSAVTTLTATVKPVIKPTSPNVLPLVETKNLNATVLNLDVIVTSVSRRTRKFTNNACFVLLSICFLLHPYFYQYYIDYHLAKTMNFFFPVETRGQSLEAPGVIEVVCVLYVDLLQRVLINSHLDWLYC